MANTNQPGGKLDLALLQSLPPEQQAAALAAPAAVVGLANKGEASRTATLIEKLSPSHQAAVLSAPNAAIALNVAAGTSATIDMLLSDVEMPQMSEPDLGEMLKKSRPEMHVMLMSGGNNGNLLVLNYGWAYIQKPFVAKKLVQMVTDVLHSPNRSQLGGQEFDSRKDTARGEKPETL